MLPFVGMIRLKFWLDADVRIAIVETSETFVFLVISGLLGTIASSWSPAPFALYSGATWSAISLVMFAVLLVAGFHVDHARLLRRARLACDEHDADDRGDEDGRRARRR